MKTKDIEKNSVTIKKKYDKFPLEEIKIVERLVRPERFSTLHIFSMDYEDFIQEILLTIIEKKCKYEKLRDNENFNRLYLKRVIQNEIFTFYKTLVQRELDFSHKELNLLIEKELVERRGACYNFVQGLKENEQKYFETIYIKKKGPKAKASAELNITKSRMNIIELKIKQTARIAMFYNIFELNNEIGEEYE